MRADNRERVRRRVLEQAVADNLDTMRGLPPRALRTSSRFAATLLRRAPMLLMLTVAVMAYFATARPSPGPELALSAAKGPPSPASGRGRAIAYTAAAVTPVVSAEPLQRVAASAFPLSVRRVVLDAGHGGKDAGATAVALMEKDITLDIGARLRRLLEERGFEVVATRGDDQTIALRDRVRLANDSRGDIFVSIHVNSIIKYTASHGVETYYLGPTNDPKLTELAAAENRMSGYSLADLRKLLDGIYADARRDESQELATTVQKHLFGRLQTADRGLENWGVKRAPFVVLVATEMPAVLAEVGCLSNRREAAQLGRPEYRQQIAEALFDGIHAYASSQDAPKKGT
jgi:N-acetylmuramoyl-L-alanine amidase